MSYNDTLEEIRSKLGESREENDKLLRELAGKYAQEGNGEGFEAVEQLLMENLPEATRKEMMRITHVDGVRLDKMYEQINQLIGERKFVEAKSLAERLYKKITVEFREGEKAKFVSLRNPFEDNLYQLLYKPEKKLNRAPFDFATYITAYAYIMTETGSPLDAIPILEKAIEFNPVDCGPKFELAEVYKLLKNRRRLEEITRDTLRVASSPVALSRCYANMGYLLTDAQEYDDAAAFYTASVMYAPDPMIPLEMQNIANRTNKPIRHPEREKVIETMKKYGIEYGVNTDVLSVCAQLAVHYLGEKDIPNALQALKMTYNLTRDEKIKEMILKYDPNAERLVPDQKPVSENGKPNITQTVNEDK